MVSACTPNDVVMGSQVATVRCALFVLFLYYMLVVV